MFRLPQRHVACPETPDTPGCIEVRSEPNFQPTFFSFSKLLDGVSGPDILEKLFRVEDTPSARFARYGKKINFLICLWFYVGWEIDLM